MHGLSFQVFQRTDGCGKETIYIYIHKFKISIYHLSFSFGTEIEPHAIVKSRYRGYLPSLRKFIDSYGFIFQREIRRIERKLDLQLSIRAWGLGLQTSKATKLLQSMNIPVQAKAAPNRRWRARAAVRWVGSKSFYTCNRSACVDRPTIDDE